MTNTLFIGKVYHRFDELPSTNDWAAELLAKSKPPEGTAVRADSQSAGRGQYGSRWESAAGKNLTISIILYPRWLEVSAQFYLSMAVALGVQDAADGGRWTADGGRRTVHGGQKPLAPENQLDENPHPEPCTVNRPPS
ncbi:MAG TPA: hypothetical protein PK228_12640, partial [Saprospiraceae bacterium]|nr:hypothetical protein [Saprospiraceae bacterium]